MGTEDQVDCVGPLWTQGRRSGITGGGLEIKLQHFVCFSGKSHNKCFKA